MGRSRWHPLVASALLASLVSPAPAFSQGRTLAQPLVKKMEGLKWVRLFPELGDRSPRMATLRIDPKTHATQILVRFGGPFHIPLHWHSSSESAMMVRGHMRVELNGVTSELDRGDFNYVPAKMPHETWIGKDGCTVYISTDGPWDFDWVDRPPTRVDFFGERKR